jgi:hypothetical protein
MGITLTISDSVMLILTIGLVYFAYVQHRLERSRTKWERYARIHNIYRKIVEFISDMSSYDQRTHDRSRQFLQETREAEFLIGTKVREFIDELYRESVTLETHTKQWLAMDGNTDHPEFQLHVTEMQKSEKWFRGQSERAKEIFFPMLNLGEEYS